MRHLSHITNLLASGTILVCSIAAMPSLAAPGPRPTQGGSQTQRTELRLEARTAVPGTQIRGKAAYRARTQGGITRESLSVEVQGAVPNSTYVVVIAGRNFGTITINSLGLGKLDLASGGDDANQVPPMNLSAGNSVAIGAMQGSLAVR